MTPRQKRLARHALGLPNAQNRSYRNRFIATYAPGDFDDWAAMARAGLADHAAPVAALGGRITTYRFWLTEAGAEAALEPGEQLDPEDFPK